jgi:hypothetical protein
VLYWILRQDIQNLDLKSMINSIEDLRSAGVLPTGPVSAWPQERNNPMPSLQKGVMPERHGYQSYDITENQDESDPKKKKIKPSITQMAGNLMNTGRQALVNGKVSPQIRKERYDICKSCEYFIEDSKRCSECGCFMEAKTWVGGNPDMLCPKQKWPR